MQIVFYGNRGTRTIGADSNGDYGMFGGSTSCMAIKAGSKLLVLDAGSGFHDFCKDQRFTDTMAVHVLFSHYHDDHIDGLAQGRALFDSDKTIHFYGTPPEEKMTSHNGDTIYRELGPERQEREPSYITSTLRRKVISKACESDAPDLDEHHEANLKFHEFEAGQEFSIGDVKVKTIRLPHGKRFSTGYRIEHDGKSVCYVTDTHHSFDENDNPVLDPALVKFIKNADALIYDTHFTDNELDPKKNEQALKLRGYGHSTGEHGIRLCAASKVPQLIMHHHDPEKNDHTMDSYVSQLRSICEKSKIGLEITAACPKVSVLIMERPHVCVNSEIALKFLNSQRVNC